jgi:hypothetical protein
MIFFPLCLYFFPLRPCNNCSSFTDGVLGGKKGKREIKSYNVSKNYGKLGRKNQARGDIILYFSPYHFNCHNKKSTKIQLGENI